ncbi:unnamed protein product, partial [Rotaria magnacalcarata]
EQGIIAVLPHLKKFEFYFQLELPVKSIEKYQNSFASELWRQRCIVIDYSVSGILGDCDRWDVEGVGRWLQSLKHINKDYTTSFLTHGVNGYLLINSVDDEVLRDVGVSTVLHRRVILKAIDELKQKSSS